MNEEDIVRNLFTDKEELEGVKSIIAHNRAELNRGGDNFLYEYPDPDKNKKEFDEYIQHNKEVWISADGLTFATYRDVDGEEYRFELTENDDKPIMDFISLSESYQLFFHE